MELNIEKQTLMLEGQTLTASDIKSVVERGFDGLPPHLSDLYRFLDAWFDGDDYIDVQTSGSTGAPKLLKVQKRKMMNSAVMTCSYLGLAPGDKALLCMNLKYIGAKMVVVRALVCGLDLYVVPVSGRPFAGLDVSFRFAAVVPVQIYNTLQYEDDLKNAARTGIIIIGGGAVSPELQESLEVLPSDVYSTYGMTETLSHIALRKLNGEGASWYYYPLPGVKVFQSESGTLSVDAPGLCDDILKTNDLVEFGLDGGFRILGRADNVINSGGIKICPEQVEEVISGILKRRFVLTSVPDLKFGEITVLMVEGNDAVPDDVIANMKKLLPKYHFPKHIIYVDAVPLAGNGKIARQACRELCIKTFNSDGNV